MLRKIAWIFIALAGIVLCADIYAGMADEIRLRATGEWWFMTHPDSLQVLQPAIERHVSVDLWVHVVQPLLEWPLAVELFCIAVVLFLLGRRRA